MSRRACAYPGCPNTTRRGSGRCHTHRYADRGAIAATPLPVDYFGRVEPGTDADAGPAAPDDGLEPR